MESGRSNSQPPHPRARANPLSAITFWWMLGVFRLGYKRDIETSDLYVPLDEHKSDYLGDKFERYWFKEIIQAKQSAKTPSLFRVIVTSFGLNFMFYGLIRALVEIFIRLAQPMFLGQLLLYFSPGNLVTKSEAYWYAGGMVACSVIVTMVIHPYMMAMFHMGMKIRIASCSLIYRKALRLNRTALGETTVGQIVNLLSNDVHRFDRSLLFLHYLWLGPLVSLIVAYLVYVELGVAGIGGIIAMLLFIPVQGYLGKKTSVFRLRTAICTDERVRLMNEIISGIQVIKLYTWEMPFAKLVSKARKNEIHVVRLTSYIRSIIPSLNIFVTRFGIYVSILSFVFTGNTITAQKVFVITAYYNIIRATMTNSFPKGITDAAEGWVSIGRVQKFLLYEELEVSPRIAFTKDNAVNDTRSDKTHAITMTKGSAKWLPQSPENTLSNINLSVRPGQLVAVIGPVGTGKTSLLNAILGELPLFPDGSLHVNGQLSYASQEPWLFSASVRQNILFGQPWNEQHYHRVLHACSLVRDLEELPHGDQTLVGERGVVLSGGQRARVNLARAVYSDADIYLLDDPLSAVDASVGRRLFEDCITGLLKNKTCLLVTHQLQHLSQVDHLVILNNGAVEAQGTYSQLQKTGLDFAKLLGKQEESGEAAVEKDVQNGKKKSVSLVEVITSPSKDKPEAAPQMQVKETRTSGQVRGNVYQSYFSAAGNSCVLFFVAALFLLTPIVGMGTDVWLAHWTNLEELRSSSIENISNETSWNTSVTSVKNSNILSPYDSERIDSGWWFNLDTDVCIYIYSAFVGGTIFITMFRSVLFFNLCMRASMQLHNRMFNAMTRAPMHFFNTNPTGRILNRFSKDIGCIDETLPTTMIECFQIILILGAITIMIAVLNYWLLVPTVAIGILFYLLRYFFLATSRSVKRLEGITRSPVFSHLSASLQGLTTIRALRAQDVLIKEFDSHQDLNSTAFYIFFAANRAFGLWLDLGVIIYLVFVTFSFLLIGEGSFAGNVGLAITQTLGLMGMFQWGMRQSAELENQMTAVERVLEYTDIEQEPPLTTSPDKSPQKEWPSLGAITFDNVSLRYGETGLVLKDICFTVKSMEKVGIVGRTGAGKSSLIAALFRLVDIDGAILIDGINTKNIGLHDLRGHLSIIPQEPVLFSGTLRRNLDPFDEYSDDLLWQTLAEVELKNVVNDQVAGLNWRTSEGGSNLSVGQRQLVCLARAIIKNNKILVLDEATANVDPQTDAFIQNTIRRKFANCTVLTIAHRLHTVMDSDRLLVIDAGRVVEFDQPHVLLQKPDGLLSGMVQQSGKTAAEDLAIVAKMNYNKSFHQKSS